MTPGKMFAIVLLLMTVGRVSGLCNDISSSACQEMYAKEPTICQDPAVAHSVCPKFCGLCPLTCYECAHAVRNYTDCEIQKQCSVGEFCLLATMLGSDGHLEYKMNCANDQHCDGQSFLDLLGKRSLHARSLTMKCCSNDLCNTPPVMYPATTAPPTMTTTSAPTTTPSAPPTTPSAPPTTPSAPPTTPSAPPTTPSAPITTPLPTTVPSSTTQSQQMATTSGKCQRDIEVLVESTTSHTPDQINDLKHFLSNVVNGLDISADGSAMGTAIFDENIANQHSLSTDKLTVYTDVNSLSFNGGDKIELDDVIHHLTRHESVELPGGQPDRENVIVFIFDHFTRHDDGASTADLTALENFSHDVIVINIGRRHHMFSQLATDSQHELTVPDYASLPTIRDALINLICI